MIDFVTAPIQLGSQARYTIKRSVFIDIHDFVLSSFIGGNSADFSTTFIIKAGSRNVEQLQLTMDT